MKKTLLTAISITLSSIIYSQTVTVTDQIILRNNSNSAYAGGKIDFASLGELNASAGTIHPGSQIRNSLTNASGTASMSSLILSSYWGGYKDELTLIDGKVGVGTYAPQSKLHIFQPGSSTPIDAMTIDVESFSTSANADASHFFRVRDLGANGIIPFIIKGNGNVGIGTSTPQYRLDVNGKSSFADNMRVNAKIEAKEIKVTLTPTADFVFENDYNLPKLEDVEKHIKEKKHLPEIASAKEMEKEGVNVGEFQIKLLQKIEELTLYTIEQNKLIKEQQKRIEALENQNKNKELNVNNL
ncbi:hypothetical protein [uncultured Chryseobacterium sp.]|uniref:hypothetical protein n=1 Tax=uncultured Chryseobacterium sp. TaxID=259322 RepID=UPI0025F8E993|nr:hypothetical protein [uncultured Chryseobacterium sp.]